MGRDAQQVGKRLRIYCRDATTRAKGALAPLSAKSLKNFNPKMQAFKHVFELLCR